MHHVKWSLCAEILPVLSAVSMSMQLEDGRLIYKASNALVVVGHNIVDKRQQWCEVVNIPPPPYHRQPQTKVRVEVHNKLCDQNLSSRHPNAFGVCHTFLFICILTLLLLLLFLLLLLLPFALVGDKNVAARNTVGHSIT